MSESRIVPTREGYDQWADFYDDDDNPLVAIETPLVREALGSVSGRSILDLGCGTGRHSLHFANEGADVTAVDFSSGMLAQARSKPGSDRVNFLVHDLATRLPLEKEQFDCVLSCLVLDHIPEPDHLFREAVRLCRPEGCVVVTVMHPALMLRGVTARFRDPQSGEETRPESESHQISDYVLAAVRSGLKLQDMSEHAGDERLASLSPRAQRYIGFPLLLMMQLQPE